MFFKKKKEDGIINEINGLGGTMQPLNSMQNNSSLDSSGMQPIPGLDQSGSSDMPIQNNMVSNNISSEMNDFNTDMNQSPAQMNPSGDLPQFNNPNQSYQEQSVPVDMNVSQNIEQNNLNQPFQEAPSGDLPIFEKPVEDLDLLVPTPPPNLLQKRAFSVDRLEAVEQEFNSISHTEEYDFERKEVDSKRPIFIKVENYEVTLKNIMAMKNNVKEFSEVMFRLENLEDSQNSKFNSLQSQVEDVQRKLIFIDNLIFEVQK